MLNGFSETLQVVDCDSMDEAIKIVEKEVKDRLAALSNQAPKPPEPVGEPAKAALPDMVKTYSDRDMDNEVPNKIPTTSNKQPA